MFEELSDAELRMSADKCYADVCAAASVQKDSEWHQACFAALFLLCEEMTRRGLKFETQAIKH